MTTKRKNTIVALRIPKAEMGITLLIGGQKRHHGGERRDADGL